MCCFSKCTPYDRSLLTEECLKFIDNDMVKLGLKGGFLEVPVDWENPHRSKTLQVFYYHRGDVDLSSRNPVLFMNGGPNVSYRGRAEKMNELFYGQEQSQDSVLVMMDHRGVGCSSPLDPNNVVYPLSTIRHYTSEPIAKDMEMLRKELFPDKKWNVYAFSYGAFTAVRYLQEFPNSVEKMSVFGPGLYDSMTDFYFYRMMRQQKIVEGFIEQFPSIPVMAAIEKLRSPEGQLYCVEDPNFDQKICGQPLLDAILVALGNGYANADGQLNGRGEFVKSSIELLVGSDANNPTDSKKVEFEKNAHEGLQWFAEQRAHLIVGLWALDTQSVAWDVKDCEMAYERMNQMGLNPSSLLLDECRMISAASPTKLMSRLQKDFESIDWKLNLISKDSLVKALEAHPVPFQLIFGSQDFYAQPENFESILSHPLIKHQVLPDVGHSAYRESAELFKIILSDTQTNSECGKVFE